jgi:regulator of protease activity HflC (stomatin/prohibitin superfamily)
MKMIVEAYEKGLRFRNGRFVEVLEPGRYRIARFLAKERIEKVDLRLRTLVLNGQEMMTLDKVTLRLTSLVSLRVKDPVAATLKVDNFAAQVYSDAQLALRDHVGALELDALLAAKARLGERILDEVKLGADAYGVEVLNVGLRDIVLPGEMKAILNQVMEARKKAEAANIERREEVAATRSLANTAQMLEKNPTLMHLKELETLERIASKASNFVLGPELLRLLMKEPNRLA